MTHPAIMVRSIGPWLFGSTHVASTLSASHVLERLFGRLKESVASVPAMTSWLAGSFPAAAARESAVSRRIKNQNHNIKAGLVIKTEENETCNMLSADRSIRNGTH